MLDTEPKPATIAAPDELKLSVGKGGQVTDDFLTEWAASLDHQSSPPLDNGGQIEVRLTPPEPAKPGKRANASSQRSPRPTDQVVGKQRRSLAELQDIAKAEQRQRMSQRGSEHLAIPTNVTVDLVTMADGEEDWGPERPMRNSRPANSPPPAPDLAPPRQSEASRDLDSTNVTPRIDRPAQPQRPRPRPPRAASAHSAHEDGSRPARPSRRPAASPRAVSASPRASRDEHESSERKQKKKSRREVASDLASGEQRLTIPGGGPRRASSSPAGARRVSARRSAASAEEPPATNAEWPVNMF